MHSTIATKITLFALILLAFAATIMPESTADTTREPQTLYLHLYSNRYDINSMGKAPPPPRDWQCIATASVVSGYRFYFNLPCHYEPEMRIEGKLDRSGDRIETNFTIDVADVGPAYRHVQKTPLALNALQGFGDEDFKFSISDSRTPAVIQLER